MAHRDTLSGWALINSEKKSYVHITSLRFLMIWQSTVYFLQYVVYFQIQFKKKIHYPFSFDHLEQCCQNIQEKTDQLTVLLIFHLSNPKTLQSSYPQ